MGFNFLHLPKKIEPITGVDLGYRDGDMLVVHYDPRYMTREEAKSIKSIYKKVLFLDKTTSLSVIRQ